MSTATETTPILHHNEDEEANEHTSESPVIRGANDYFRRPLRVLTIATISITVLTSIIATAVYIRVSTGPFDGRWLQISKSGALAFVSMGGAIITLLTFLIECPILISFILNLGTGVYLFPLSVDLFDYPYPTVDFMCGHRDRYEPHKTQPTQECIDAVRILQYPWTASAILGLIAVGLLAVILILRIVAMARTRFWSRTTLPNAPRLWGSWRNATGFTVHFSFSVIPAGTIPTIIENREGSDARDAGREERGEREPLIET